MVSIVLTEPFKKKNDTMKTYSSSVALKIARRIPLLGLVPCLMVMDGFGQPAPCTPAILPGTWRLRAMAVTNKFEGAAVIDGVSYDFRGQVGSTATPGDATSFVVDCNGNIVNGRGQDTISGQLVQTVIAPAATVTTTTTYSGGESYTFTGNAVMGANGKPELNLNIRVISGSTTAAGQTVAVTAFGTFSQSFGNTENLAGQSLAMRMPVLNYDQQSGVIEVDMRDSPLFKQLQNQVDQATAGNPVNMKITYSGSATFESTAITIENVVTQYKKYYLKDVQAMNHFDATINWRNSGSQREVVFTYGSDEVHDSSGADTSSADFDMGKTPDRLVVTATAGSDSADPFTVELKKVTVSPWAKPVITGGGPGIIYEGDAQWPPLPSINSFFGNSPIVGGLWSLFSNGRNNCAIKGYSEGPPAGQGDLDWFYHLGVPFTSTKMEFALSGHTSTTINPSGLNMTGDADLKPFVWSGSKMVGLPDLIPGVGAAACGFSSSLCNFVYGVGIEGSLNFSLGGRGTFSADEADNKIEWDTGTATAKLRAQLTISIVPPPLQDIIFARVWGAGTACLDLQFHPDISVSHFGAELEAGYEVQLVGIQVAHDPHTWPLIGGGCGGGTPRPFRLQSAGEAAGGIPTDGQPRVCLGPNGLSATVWSGVTDGTSRAGGDIFLQIADQNGGQAPIRLTDDIAADKSPRVVFEKNGRVVVAWQRNPTDNPEMMTNQVETFARGFELAYAIVDLLQTNIVASGVLTTNTDVDFGPALQANAAGEVMLCWERTRTLSLVGTPDDPAALYACFWNGTNWSQPEAVVTNLTGLYGWRSAMASPDLAALAYTLDQDGSFTNANDQEVFLVRRENGVWREPRRLTTNEAPDRSPQPTYLQDGRLAVGWLSDNKVIGLVGDLTAQPSTWIEPNDFLNLNFCRAELVARGNRLLAVWPAANDLYAVEVPIARRALLATLPSSGQPKSLRFNQDDVETAFAAELDDAGSLRYAAIVAPILPGSLPELGPTATLLAETIRFGATNTTAPRILAFTPPAGGQARLTWESVPGSTYVLQQSTDLLTWTDVAEVTATAATATSGVNLPANSDTRFFRLKVK